MANPDSDQLPLAQRPEKDMERRLQHPCEPLARVRMEIGRDFFRRAFGDDAAAAFPALGQGR